MHEEIETVGAVPAFDVSSLGHVGLDVGGSLSKICIYEPSGDIDIHVSRLLSFIRQSTTYGSTGRRDVNLSLKTPHGCFHFIVFETHRMDSAVKLLLQADLFKDLSASRKVISATGGGAHRFDELFASLNGEGNVRKVDEMTALVRGLSFLLTKTRCGECFYYAISSVTPAGMYDAFERQPAKVDLEFNKDNGNAVFPYMLVNIGTGVSILKIHADGTYERISGSGIGGGTYWGLIRLLTHVSNFDESLKISVEGKTRNVDMTVGDIYGGAYESLGLPADMTAGFFAKFGARADENLKDNVSDADICRGLLMMVTNNIGQISYLLAKLHSVKHIFFTGNFLRQSGGVDMTRIALSRAISFWSNNEMRALFLRHDGYFGALGAYLPPHIDKQ